jgi:TetR/AcrR family transcriptional repressor of lmrAB and yxaGH operons
VARRSGADGGWDCPASCEQGSAGDVVLRDRRTHRVPRGSIYRHFPNGKNELVVAALDRAGAQALQALDTVARSGEVTEFFLGSWRHLLTHADFEAGCAVLAVTVAADSAELLAHAGEVFERWHLRLTELLERGGLRPADASDFAAVLIASSEGAVAVSRARHSLEPFDAIARQLVARVNQRLVQRQVEAR